MTNNAASLYNRSLAYLDGRGVAEDERKAFRLNAEAAASGYRDAVLAMGWFYLNGVGTEPDPAEAKAWYERSARQRDPRAMFSLGEIANNAGDFTAAFTWLRRAADLGHHRSLYWLGKLHWRGLGVDTDRKCAMRLFTEAAQHKVREAQRFLRLRNHLDHEANTHSTGRSSRTTRCT